MAGCAILVITSCGVCAEDNDVNPYAIISSRNVFRLNAVPLPSPEPEVSKADAPAIKITGIIRIGDVARALFVIQPKDSKTSPTYFDLAAGERDGILEVVQINPEARKVDIINSGMPMTLTVKDDSLALNDTGAPDAEPPLPPGARARTPNPNALHYPRMLPRAGQ